MPAKNPRVVRAHQEFEFTPEQLKELKKCAKDPEYFIVKYVRIQHPLLGSVPFELYDFQREMIQNFQQHKYNILLASRQVGKTTTVGAYLLWFTIFNDDKTVLIVSNKNSNAMEIIERIRYAYESLPNWLKPGVMEDGWNKHSISFDNDSRILSEATTEQSGRGLSISLLFCDEFAHVKNNIQDEFWTSIQPTLSTGGNCIIASTPNGDTNLFAQLWREAESRKNEFHPRWVKWDEPPGRDETFKRKQIANLGSMEKWQQEFECIFLSSDATLIASRFLLSLNDQVSLPEPNEKGFRFWSQIGKGKTYLIAIDPATGTGKDFTAMEVVEFPSLKQVAEWRFNTMDHATMYLALKWILRRIEIVGGQAYFSVENNGVGQALIALYQFDEEPPNIGEFLCEEGKDKLGFSTQGKSKMKACANFKALLEKSKYTIYSKDLLTELKYFVRREGTWKAQIGATDDCVSAYLVLTRMLEEVAAYEQEAFDAMYVVDEDGYLDDEEYDDKDEGMPISVGNAAFVGNGAQGNWTNREDPNSFDPFAQFPQNIKRIGR